MSELSKRTPVIVDLGRSPIDKMLGVTSGKIIEVAGKVGSVILNRLIGRYPKLDPEMFNGIILGHVLDTMYGQSTAAQVGKRMGLPDTVPPMNIKTVCGSAMSSAFVACDAIWADRGRDLFFIGGLEDMGAAPFALKQNIRLMGWPMMTARVRKIAEKVALWAESKEANIGFDELTLLDLMILDGLTDATRDIHMGVIAEEIAVQAKLDRETLDKIAAQSHERALDAIENGWFSDEIIPVELDGGVMFDTDQGPRKPNLEKMAQLPTIFKPDGGMVTAGNASQISSGFAGGVICSLGFAEANDLEPLAYIHDYHHESCDSDDLFWAPVGGIQQLLAQNSLKVDDDDILFEINEAFVAQVEADRRELDIPWERLNVHGGATALGHPIGASAWRIVVTLFHAMKRLGKKKGIASACHGHGGSVNIYIERAV